MNLTLLKTCFAKRKHEIVFYNDYKKFDNLKFKETVNRELIKHDVNNIDHVIFHEILLSILKRLKPLTIINVTFVLVFL